MKTLVTHRYPHLDDIAAIWLWKKYVPGWAKAKIGFVDLKGNGAPATWKNKPADSDPTVVHVGVGKGKFDEHKGDIGKCCTFLVYEELVKRKYIPKSESLAIAKFVDFVNLQDTGRTKDMPYQAMFVPTILRNVPDSHDRQKLGEHLIELSLVTFANDAVLERDWKKRVEFMTPWGKGVAMTTNADGADWMGYQNGFPLVIAVDPVRKWRMFRADANSSVDLTAAYETLKKIDPKSSWFLHHSKHMMMSGSRSSPNVVTSKLPLKKLVEIVQHDATGTDKRKA